jgi:hypothetical protein
VAEGSPELRITDTDGTYADRLTVVYRGVDNRAFDTDRGPAIVFITHPGGSRLAIEPLRRPAWPNTANDQWGVPVQRLEARQQGVSHRGTPPSSSSGAAAGLYWIGDNSVSPERLGAVNVRNAAFSRGPASSFTAVATWRR